MTPLVAFFTHASLEAGDNQAQAGQDAVQMMTVHAAKGLEFHVVFITGLEEGLFPHENSQMEKDGLEEERRLMYVAITRARERLYLSFAQSRVLHGQIRYHIRSRFFDELPEDTLKWLTPQQSGYTATRRTQGESAWGNDWFKRPQRGDAVLGRGVRGEQIVHALPGQRVDDEHVRGRRIALGVVVRDLVRGILDARERRGQRHRVAADARAEIVGGVFAGAADRHLHQHGCERRQDHHR